MTEALTFRLHPAIAEIPASAWDALAPDQPFLRHTFLHALEASGCVGTGTGWAPAHAALWQGEALVAAAPLYAKSHSYGEYVFDWAWADAYQRNGLAYYPKWLCAIPFSPVPGARLLGRDEAARSGLLAAMLGHAQPSGCSSLHLLYPTEEECALGQEAGMMRREGVQFHWHSAGYAGFEEFLGALSHDKRKKIRQERRRLAEAGVTLHVLEGDDITPAHWRFFVQCYRNTYALHGATPYLNLDFFERLGSQLPDACVLLIGRRAGQDIAASLLLRDETALYGRYWGALEYVPGLHFEACYYAPIAFAIARGLLRFEGGAQGEHKLARGLLPVVTHSLHWLADARFADAIARFLQRETGGMALYVDELERRAPFRK